MSQPKEEARTMPKDFLLSFLCSGAIMTPALLFSLKSDLPHVGVVCALILAFSLLTRKAIAFGDRPIIYFTVVSLALASFLDMAMPMDGSRNGILDILVSSSLTAPALLYMACFATFIEQKPMAIGVVVALSISAMLVGGDMLRDSMPPSPVRLNFEGVKYITSHFRMLYLVSVTLEMAFIVAVLQRQSLCRHLDATRSSLWARRLFRLALVALLPVIAVIGIRFFYAHEGSFRQVERYLTGSSFMRRQGQQLPFSGSPDLTKGLPKEDARRAAMIVARVKASAAPGLLRARGFSTYDAGRWTAPVEKSPVSGVSQSDAITSKIFWLFGSVSPADAKKLKRMEIFQSNTFSSELLLIPANAQAIEIVSERLSASADGLIEPVEWKASTGFTAFIPSVDQFSGYSIPSAGHVSQEYLAVPEGLKPTLKIIAAEAAGIAATSKFKGDFSLANAIASVLRNRCKYTLETKDTPQGVDPVENFLIRTKEGHCELFASAAVLTLRSVGIPARYATGLVCDETHPSGSYFVARLGGAHAWCEAFLKDESGAGRWVAIDPTPASEFELFHPKWGIGDAITDWLSQTIRHAFAWLQRGYFASAVFELVGDIAFGVWAFASSVYGFIFEMLLVAAAIFYWLRWRARALKKAAVSSQTLMQLLRQFKSVEKAASARSGLRRPGNMTLEEWAASAEGSCSGLLEIVRSYEALRFRQSPPSELDVAEFKRKVDSFLNQMKARA